MMKLKDMVGTGSWGLRQQAKPNIASSGIDDVWFRKTSTLAELLAACQRPAWITQPGDYFAFSEWVKDGRKTVRKETKRYVVEVAQ